jgi:hypothetical protein
MPAADPYEKGMHPRLLTRIDLYKTLTSEEPDFDTVESEVFCCVHELHKTWDGKRGLVGRRGSVEVNFKLLQTRSSDPTNKCF